MTRKSDPLRKPTKQEREAQSLAIELKRMYGTQDAAALKCEIHKARFSHIIHGNFAEVAITELDIKAMRVIVAGRKSDVELNTETRSAMRQFEGDIAEVNRAVHKASKSATIVIRLLKRRGYHA
jgi:hypothetical protein